MKRCPECRRDYHDDTLSFCLADGSELVYGLYVEPATAMLSEAPALSNAEYASEGVTSPQIHTTEKTAVLPSGISAIAKPKGFDKRLLLAPLALAAIVAGGFFGYQYFSPTSRQIDSIAVMPFVNDSRNADYDYLSDGMTETLINSLSQIPNLSVKARSTVFRFKDKGATPQQVGNELSVQAVLSGRVALHGDQLTLSLELVNARTGDQIWGDKYVRKATDIVTLQNEVARDVASNLRAKLSNASEQKLAKIYTANPEAYRLYLQGMFYWNQLNVTKATEYFQQAIEADPGFALAYSGLGDSYLLRIATSSPEQTPAKADEALSKAGLYAAKALELDPDLPDAHVLMGFLLLQRDRDFTGCERELLRALELNPNFAEGHRRNGVRLFYLGEFDAALAEYRKALNLDPLSSLTNFNYAQALVFAGRHDEAEAQIQKNLKMDPGFGLFHAQLSTLYRLKGNYAGAVEENAKMSELQSQPERARLKRETFAKAGWKGFLQSQVKEFEQSRASPYWLAVAYIELGEKEKALAALEEVFNIHSNFVGYFKIDPQLDPLRDHQRFKALLKRSGYTE